MDTRDLAKLACRVLALYFTIFVLLSIPWLFYSLVNVRSFSLSDVTFTSLLFTAGGFLGNLLVSLFLWLQAGRVAVWLAPEPKGMSLGEPSLRTLQKLTFSAIGLVFAVSGFATLLEVGVSNFLTVGLTNRWDGPVSAVIRFVIGLWLLFSADELIKVLNRLEQNRAEDEGQATG